VGSGAVGVGRNRNKVWHKGNLGYEDDARTSNTHSAEKTHDATLDEEKYCSQHNTLLYNITLPT